MVTRGDTKDEASSNIVAQLASEFLLDTLRQITRVPGRLESPPLLRVAAHTDYEGYLRLTLALTDESRLSIAMYVDTAGRTPAILSYAFHHQDPEGQCIIRYDNAPHHHELGGFPHHKHVGPDERVVESGLPDLGSVLEEVRSHIAGD